MKKILFALILVLFLFAPITSYAVGTAVIGTPVRYKNVDGKYTKYVLPIVFTADGAAAEGTYSLVPATHGIAGWFLFDVYTDPGSTGPSNGAWDLDITDATMNFVVSATSIDDRSSTATQRVTGATLAYPPILNTWSITIGDNAVNDAVVTVYLVFVDSLGGVY